jgi:hypothetical protein
VREAALGLGTGEWFGPGNFLARSVGFPLDSNFGADSSAKSSIRGTASELTSQPFNSLRSNSSSLISLCT